MVSSAFSHLKSVLILDQQKKIEAMVREGILSYPCQMDFLYARKADILKRIERDPPDLIVSGLELQDSNALDLVVDLKKKFGGIPAILLADPSQIEMQKEIVKLGAFDVLQRPFPIQDLIKKIDRAVRISGSHHKTRIESFLEYAKLQDESASKGILVSELLDQKSSTDGN